MLIANSDSIQPTVLVSNLVALPAANTNLIVGVN